MSHKGFGCQCLGGHDYGVTNEGGILSRRGALRLTLLGAGATIVGTILPWADAGASGHAEALLLSCMDYRLVDDIVRYMGGRQLTNRYDHVVLAGASLGAVTDKFPNWGQTFWTHLDVAIKLHHIRKVIVLDHRDCGAYQVLLGKDLTGDAERAMHAEQMGRLGMAIKEKHPVLEVELYLMALDGSVETIA